MHNTGNKLVICQSQMQNQIFQSSAKFMHGKIEKTNLIFLYIHLVETVALILHSKIVFKRHFWLKLLMLTKYTTCT